MHYYAVIRPVCNFNTCIVLSTATATLTWTDPVQALHPIVPYPPRKAAMGNVRAEGRLFCCASSAHVEASYALKCPKNAAEVSWKSTRWSSLRVVPFRCRIFPRTLISSWGSTSWYGLGIGPLSRMMTRCKSLVFEMKVSFMIIEFFFSGVTKDAMDQYLEMRDRLDPARLVLLKLYTITE